MHSVNRLHQHGIITSLDYKGSRFWNGSPFYQNALNLIVANEINQKLKSKPDPEAEIDVLHPNATRSLMAGPFGASLDDSTIHIIMDIDRRKVPSPGTEATEINSVLKDSNVRVINRISQIEKEYLASPNLYDFTLEAKGLTAKANAIVPNTCENKFARYDLLREAFFLNPNRHSRRAALKELHLLGLDLTQSYFRAFDL